MKKTGEAYTAARAQILAKQKTKARDIAALAGMSDAAVAKNTGHPWSFWLRELDGHGADRMAHRDIAALVHDTYKVPDWWTQMVTVGYERIKGLRERGQRRDGTFEASKSRTYSVPVGTLYEAWFDAGIRRRWLKPSVKVRTATAPKSMRLGWSDGSIVAVGFAAKGSGKSNVAVQHTKLPDRAAAERLKKEWGELFTALGEVLAER
jgi:hypothetical protein